MDVYAWTFHWTCCRFSKSVVKKGQIFKMTTNKNQTTYCNLGLMHQKDHK